MSLWAACARWTACENWHECHEISAEHRISKMWLSSYRAIEWNRSSERIACSQTRISGSKMATWFVNSMHWGLQLHDCTAVQTSCTIISILFICTCYVVPPTTYYNNFRCIVSCSVTKVYMCLTYRIFLIILYVGSLSAPQHTNKLH